MGTYAWDFVFANGDSIKEKHEDLIEKLGCLCLQKVGSMKSAKVYAHPCIASGILVFADMTVGYEFEAVSSDSYNDGSGVLGKVKHDCGNGYQSGFMLYETKPCEESEVFIPVRPKKDEIIVEVGEEKHTIKVFNYIFDGFFESQGK